MKINRPEKKILFGVTLFILIVSMVNNIRSLIQMVTNGAPIAIDQSKVAIIIGTIFFIILGVVIRDIRWRIGWLMLIFNNLFDVLAVNAFEQGKVLFAISAVLLAISVLGIGALNFFKSKKIVFTS